MAISRRSKLKTSCRRCSNFVTRLSAPLAGPARRFSCKRGESVANRGFVERHHRVAIVFLIAGVDQRVERERVVVGRGDVFFDQGAEYASFDFGEEHAWSEFEFYLDIE